MGLFGKKRSLPPLVSDNSTPVINFNTVVEYLEGLSKQDLDKLLKVVNIYRNASKDVNKVLGIKDEPSVTINKETADESELSPADSIDFLLDEEPAEKPPTTPKKIKVD